MTRSRIRPASRSSNRSSPTPRSRRRISRCSAPISKPSSTPACQSSLVRIPGFIGVLVGAATQIELELLVEAGLKPEDALRAATINAARMIGKEKDLGTIEAGKAADLVILDADPRADIRNVARINRTFKGGSRVRPGRSGEALAVMQR